MNVSNSNSGINNISTLKPVGRSSANPNPNPNLYDQENTTPQQQQQHLKRPRAADLLSLSHGQSSPGSDFKYSGFSLSLPGSNVNSSADGGGGGARTSFSRQSLDGLQASMEVDRLSLALDKSKDEAVSLAKELSSVRDHLTRQVTFLEAQNNELRQEIKGEKDKFFETKMMWQIKHKELENTIAKLSHSTSSNCSSNSNNSNNNNDANNSKNNNNNSSNYSSMTSSGNNSNNSNNSGSSNNAGLLDSIKNLELQLRSKAVSEHELATRNASLEKQVKCLEQDVFLLKVTQKEIDEANSNKELKKQYYELEQSLKMKEKEFQKTFEKMENQNLLKDEINQLNNKLKVFGSKAEELKELEIKYHVLKSEKDQWVHLFRDVVTSGGGGGIGGTNTSSSSSSSSSSMSTSSEASPMVVMRTLQDLQKKCSLLLQGQSDLSTSNWQLQQSNKDLESKLVARDASFVEKTKLSQDLEKQVLRLQHHNQPFESEIACLRNLLKSYDDEFKLGRPDQARVLEVKNGEIRQLQRTLDNVRAQIAERDKEIDREKISAEKVNSTNNNASNNSNSNSNSNSYSNNSNKSIAGSNININAMNIDKCEFDESMDALRKELVQQKASNEELKGYIKDLELFTRTDFVPGRVNVLHLADNPFSRAKKEIQEAKDRAMRAGGGSGGGYAAAQSHPDEELGDVCPEDLYTSKNPKSTIPIFKLNQLTSDIRKLRADSKTEVADSHFHLHSAGGDLDQSILSTSMLASSSSSCSSGGGLGVGGNGAMGNNVDLNKINKKMKEMFRDQMKNYREAVYLLTGYKVDLIAGTGDGRQQLRLKSMYSDSPEDSILLQYRDNGVDLDLLETPFTSKISPLQFQYLKLNSVPAFLSAVTLELFENTTFMG